MVFFVSFISLAPSEKFPTLLPPCCRITSDFLHVIHQNYWPHFSKKTHQHACFIHSCDGSHYFLNICVTTVDVFYIFEFSIFPQTINGTPPSTATLMCFSHHNQNSIDLFIFEQIRIPCFVPSWANSCTMTAHMCTQGQPFCAFLPQEQQHFIVVGSTTSLYTSTYLPIAPFG